MSDTDYTERWIETQAWIFNLLGTMMNAAAALLMVYPPVKALAIIFLLFNIAMFAILSYRGDVLESKYLGSLVAYIVPHSIYIREPSSHPDVFYALSVACFIAFLATFFVGMVYDYRRP